MAAIGLVFLFVVVVYMFTDDPKTGGKVIRALALGILQGIPVIVALFAGLIWNGTNAPQCQHLPAGWACPQPPLFSGEIWGWIALGSLAIFIVELAWLIILARQEK